MTKYFTADWHLGSNYVLTNGKRPFKNIDLMDKWIIRECNARAKNDDIIYHVGDFLNKGSDRGFECTDKSFKDYKSLINTQMLFIRGNHDDRNGVKSIS